MTEQENWAMPTGQEMKEQGSGEYLPLPADDYVVKAAKIILQKEPKWNEASKSFNYNDMELKYTIICLPYKLKAEEGLFYKGGKEAKALGPWIWRSISPFSMGAMKNGDPTFLRAFTAYAQGVSAELDVSVPMPGIIVLDGKDNFASAEDTAKYKAEFKKYLNKEITIENFSMKKEGFKHIPDIRSLEGKYVGAKVALDEKGRNKITAFSKLPSSFVADATVEKEAMEKFAESYKKMKDKRDEKVDGAPSSTEVVTSDDIPF